MCAAVNREGRARARTHHRAERGAGRASPCEVGAGRAAHDTRHTRDAGARSPQLSNISPRNDITLHIRSICRERFFFALLLFGRRDETLCVTPAARPMHRCTPSRLSRLTVPCTAYILSERLLHIVPCPLFFIQRACGGDNHTNQGASCYTGNSSLCCPNSMLVFSTDRCVVQKTVSVRDHAGEVQ